MATNAAPSAAPIYPLKILRSLVTELEAALTLARTDPDKKSVHKLRTTTRRIEAELALLGRLPDLPDYSDAAAGLPRLLAKVRRAGGAVRDLDVQRDTLKASFLTQPGSKRNQQAADLHASARDLRKLLKHRRIVAADKLLRTLKRRGPRLVTQLEDLLSALGEANPALSPTALGEHASAWYRERVAAELSSAPSPDSRAPAQGVHPHSANAAPGVAATAAESPLDIARLDLDQLHTARKFAKLARYLAESGAPLGQADAKPPQPLDKIAARFHALQETGGDWHDAYTLAELARKDLGKHDPLTRALQAQSDRGLEAYKRSLGAFRS